MIDIAVIFGGYFVKNKYIQMKNLISLFSVVCILAACTSQNQDTENTNSTDTSGYIHQPQDKTQMNDTMQMQYPDTSKLYPDTITH